MGPHPSFIADTGDYPSLRVKTSISVSKYLVFVLNRRLFPYIMGRIPLVRPYYRDLRAESRLTIGLSPSNRAKMRLIMGKLPLI